MRYIFDTIGTLCTRLINVLNNVQDYNTPLKDCVDAVLIGAHRNLLAFPLKQDKNKFILPESKKRVVSKLTCRFCPYYGFITDLLQIYYGFITDLLRYYYSFITDLLRFYYSFITDILRII